MTVNMYQTNGEPSLCSPILYAQSLTEEHIRALLDDNDPILAVVIDNFVDHETCEIASKRATWNKSRTYYEDAPGIGKLGNAVYEAANDPSMIAEYDTNIARNYQITRALFPNGISPNDRIRLMIQEIWSHSATLACITNKPGFSGLIRIFSDADDEGALPHQDQPAWDVPDNPVTQAMLSQIAVNTYIQTAQEGGKVRLWDFEFSNQRAYNAFKLTGSVYGLDPDRLPPPTVEISPRVGQLILFNARKIHQVMPVIKGTRITVSCFIGYFGDDRPLALFS